MRAPAALPASAARQLSRRAALSCARLDASKLAHGRQAQRPDRPQLPHRRRRAAEPSRSRRRAYDGPESAYRLAFTDTDSCCATTCARCACSSSCSSPRWCSSEHGHRIDDRHLRQRAHRAARRGRRRCWPTRSRPATRRRCAARRCQVAMCRYYDEARHFAALVTDTLAPHRHADLRGHRRRPRHHGSRQPRRATKSAARASA